MRRFVTLIAAVLAAGTAFAQGTEPADPGPLPTVPARPALYSLSARGDPARRLEAQPQPGASSAVQGEGFAATMLGAAPGTMTPIRASVPPR